MATARGRQESGLGVALARAQKLPEKIGRYRILRALAHEQEVSCYLAAVPGEGKEAHVRLKCLGVDGTRDAIASGIFRDRTRLAKRLSHPSLPRVVDAGTADGRLFLAFAHTPTVSLRRLGALLHTRGEPMDVRALARVALDVLDALHYAHTLRDEKGRPLDIVHRDVSPDNVLVALDGRALLEESSLVRTRLSSVSTETGIVKGRFAYLAPEQVAGEPIDARADLFSLGIVLWEALAGRRLFAGSTGFSSLMSSMVTPIPRLVDVDGAVASPALSQVVERALARSPDARFPTALAMREALAAAVPDAMTNLDLSVYIASRFPEEVVEDTAKITGLPLPPTFPLSKRRVPVRWLVALCLLTIALAFAVREVVVSRP